MGGDGGTYATSRKFVRGVNGGDKDEAKDIKQEQILRTRQCAISGEVSGVVCDVSQKFLILLMLYHRFKLQVLCEPISCCELGNLYNTEAVVTALLEKRIGVNFSHIRGLKDLKKLKLCPNPNYSADKEVDGEMPAMFICPITKMELNGNLPFVAVWATGYVLSEKAIRELGVEALQDEYGPFTTDDLVKLLPTRFEIDEQTAQMVARRNKRKAEKKSSKEGVDGEGNGSKKRKHADNAEHGSSKHERTGGGPAGVGADREERGVTSLSKSSTLVKSAVEAIKAQEQQSTVFKGLFHDDKAVQKKDRDLFMSVAGMRYTLG